MRRVAVLIGIGGAILLAGATWLWAAEVGAGGSGLRPKVKYTTPTMARIDLNSAGLDELVRLPGITPQLAEQVIRNRPYRKLDDLIVRKVLGKKQFARIREFVVVNRSKP